MLLLPWSSKLYPFGVRQGWVGVEGLEVGAWGRANCNWGWIVFGLSLVSKLGSSWMSLGGLG